MFTKKTHADIKKSTAKLQDHKKDAGSRLRHLRTILDNIEHEEAKSLFEINYSHIYFILYDNFIQAEANLKQKVHKAHREELDGCLWLLERVLRLLPELLARRWQCHSMSRIMAKLLHLGNSPKLRREGVRYFLLWYQALADNAPGYVHKMYSELIPGLIVPQKGATAGPDTDFNAVDFMSHPNMKLESASTSVFHDVYSHPVQCAELAPLLPPSSSEKCAPTDPRDGLETLLNAMVQTSACLRWRDHRLAKDQRAFGFLLERFKRVFVPVFCPNFDFSASVYEPRLQCFQQAHIVREVLYATRDNVNFVHEVYRQAFLLNYTSKPQIEATRTAITVYRDWMTGSVPPPFLHEPEEDSNCVNQPHVRAGLQNVLQLFVTNAANVFLVNTSTLNIFFPTKTREYRSTPLQEQTELCKKVLNVYRTMVMNTRMAPRTWEQLLLVLLQVTSVVLHQQVPANSPKNSTLGGILGQAIFQTLIVTWIRAHTNVPVNVQLWEKFLGVLTSLTHREELIIEWDKTIQTLTRVFSRYVYALNLQDLPLDRLAENKHKRRRMGSVWQQSTACKDKPLRHITSEEAAAQSLQSTNSQASNNNNSLPEQGTRPSNLLTRSYSDGSLTAGAIARRRRLHRRQLQAHKARDLPPPPLLSNSVEHSLNFLLAGQTELEQRRSNWTQGRSLSLVSLCYGQGTDELDSLAEFNAQGSAPCSRSPSPTASSGIEGSSVKDVLASTVDDGTVGRSIILGGTATGWLPDSTAIMWKRMLGALGDVNRIPKPELHAQVFKHLLDMTNNLVRIKRNQGITVDNQTTPSMPSLVPPINIVAPWCFGALLLDSSYKKGKLYAVQLLCTLALHGTVACSMHRLPLLYYALHKLLAGQDRELMYVVLKHLEGPRFLSVLLPGHTLLLLDLINAAGMLLTSLESNRSTPRAEVAALLGSLLCYPFGLLPRPMLQPDPNVFMLMECPDLHNHMLNIMLRCARREPSAKARCIALAQLGQWLLLKLSQPEPRHFEQAVPLPTNMSSVGQHPPPVVCYNPRILEALQVLLQALQFKHRTLAIVAIDALKLCAERCQALASMARVPQLIISALCKALELQHVVKPKDSDKTVLTSLLLCLGEFCIALPAALMFAPYNDKGDTLVLLVLRVLLQIASPGGPRHERVTKHTASLVDDDFDMQISNDDLQADGKLPEANYQTAETIHACSTAIRLCARAVAMHLVTHLGHFPMGIGASRLSSLVEEQDDLGWTSSLADDDNQQRLPSVLNAQNLQLFMLRPGLLASFIELPALKLPGGGVTAGLVTAEKQVRVLLRDLNGKTCWDASILYAEPRKLQYLSGASRQTQPAPALDSLLSSMIGFDVVQPPRHTLRHRAPGTLPLAEEMAADLDQLDDLLAYVEHTSPECLTASCAQLNAPASSPLSSNLEAQAISVILGQRLSEEQYVASMADTTTTSACSLPGDSHNSIDSSIAARTELPFQYCRLLFSHLGLASWERRSRTNLLQRSEKLLRELRNVDLQRCRETHKMAVIFVAAGQEDKSSILRNTSGSSMYEMFVSALGWEIELETHSGFLGGLPRQGCGSTAPYYATPFLELVYHVSTRMPSDSSEALLLKTRHLGNDEVHIVWSEHHRDYRRDILPTEFCDVLIVVYPLKNGLFRVTVNRKSEVPWFGPLANESIVSGACLATLVRATAINASRAKRTALSLHQQYYEERNRSLETVSARYKESTTFEDFANRIYNPMPVNTFGIVRDSHVSAPLAAALIDQNRSSVKGWVQATFESNFREIPLSIAPSMSGSSSTSLETNNNNNNNSPRGPRKQAGSSSSTLKSNARRSPGLQHSNSTPPSSPTLVLRRQK